MRGIATGGGGCQDIADVPWLEAAPESGTTPGGDADEVTVAFDSTGLTPGTYRAFLCVNSNDFDQPLVTVPVTMEVEGEGGDPDITVQPDELDSDPTAQQRDD